MNYEWQPTQQNDQLQKLHEILDLVWRIEFETSHDIFYYISGHVKCIQIYIHENGWAKEKDSAYDRMTYFDGYLHNESDLIIKELEKWL